MQKRKSVHETKAKRARRDGWLKIGVWVFIAVFAFSVAGGMVLFAVQLRSK